MPMNMVQSRGEIPMDIVGGKNSRWIARKAHHGRDLIREVCRVLDPPSNLFALKHSIGTPREVKNDFIPEVAQLTRRNLRLTCTHLAGIRSPSDDFPTV
jgi:hypothetical protein